MPTIQRIRLTILNRHYYLSSHAEEEMREDHVERRDLEYAILNGKVKRRLTHDIRGTRYRIEGPTQDGRIIHVICRFQEDRHLIIITVYAREWEAIRTRMGGNMICEFCGGQTVARKVTRQHWLQEKLYIVENVDAEVCTECGERYFAATVLDTIDRTLMGDHAIKERIEVEVVRL